MDLKCISEDTGIKTDDTKGGKELVCEQEKALPQEVAQSAFCEAGHGALCATKE